jgi:hypothetical protein
LWEDRIYELAARPTVWSLGALACALRRAEFAGQAAIFRFAAIGILWTLDRLIESKPALLQEPLIKLRRFAADYFATLVIPLSGAFHLGISTRDTERFSDSVAKYLQREAEINREIWSLANGQSIS